ncbi:MAG: phage protein Gp27 family protein [Blastomonas sp.]
MPKRRRHTPSTIDRLEPEIRQLINKLRIDDGWTIDEIRDQLIRLGQGHISRSALGRHVRSLADMTSEMAETQAYAEALAKQAGNANQSELLDLNSQLLQSHMFKLMLAERDGEPVQLSTKEVQEFSSALRNIAQARKVDLDVIEKAEKRAEEKARAEMRAKLDEAGSLGLIDKDALQRAKSHLGFD